MAAKKKTVTKQKTAPPPALVKTAPAPVAHPDPLRKGFISHAGVCRCARCKSEGVNGWAPKPPVLEAVEDGGRPVIVPLSNKTFAAPAPAAFVSGDMPESKAQEIMEKVKVKRKRRTKAEMEAARAAAAMSMEQVIGGYHSPELRGLPSTLKPAALLPAVPLGTSCAGGADHPPASAQVTEVSGNGGSFYVCDACGASAVGSRAYTCTINMLPAAYSRIPAPIVTPVFQPVQQALGAGPTPTEQTLLSMDPSASLVYSDVPAAETIPALNVPAFLGAVKRKKEIATTISTLEKEKEEIDLTLGTYMEIAGQKSVSVDGTFKATLVYTTRITYTKQALLDAGVTMEQLAAAEKKSHSSHVRVSARGEAETGDKP